MHPKLRHVLPVSIVSFAIFKLLVMGFVRIFFETYAPHLIYYVQFLSLKSRLIGFFICTSKKICYCAFSFTYESCDNISKTGPDNYPFGVPFFPVVYPAAAPTWSLPPIVAPMAEPPAYGIVIEVPDENDFMGAQWVGVRTNGCPKNAQRP